MLDCLVVGGDSQIGRALVARLRAAGLTVQGTSRRPDAAGALRLDLADPLGADALPPMRTLLLLAAQTSLDACARDPDATTAINVDAPARLTEQARAQGARVIFFSSVAVHDGSAPVPSETARAHPGTAYGRQKLAAEQCILARDPAAVVLRLSKVVTPDFPLFARWANALAAGQSIEAFHDMIAAPVTLDTVLEATRTLIARPEASGVFQLSARDQGSYADFAARLAQGLGARPDLVRAVAARERLPEDALYLPRHATMDTRRLNALRGGPAPAALESVDWFLDSWRKDGP